MNPGMVYGIKSFGSVKKEEEPINLLFYASVKIGVNVDGVITAAPTAEKALLRRVNKSKDSGHNGASSEGRQNAVISVSDTKRPGVRDKASVLLGKQIKETKVKTRRGRLA